MLQTIGTVGESANDGIYPHARVTLHGRSASVAFSSQVFSLVAESDIKPGAKVTADIPDELWDQVAEFRCGGGFVNSTVAIKLVAPFTILRCLDTSAIQEALRRHLAYPHVEIRGLGLRTVRRNAVFAICGDKVIFKPKRFARPGGLNTDHLAALDWLCECPHVLANSIKDEDVLTVLARAAETGRTKLHLVLTDGLPFDFVRCVGLPQTRTVIASVDEIEKITRSGIEPTLAGAVEAAARFRRIAPQAAIHVTCGKGGAVVVEPGCSSAYRVCLGRVAWSGVQRLVAADPSAVCGAGDAYAGGVVAAQVAESCGWASAPVAAGCAAAARWIGFTRRLRAADFAVSMVPLAAAA